MSTLLKVLLGLLIALPMTAYVVGSLAASSSDRPSRLDPVVITGAPTTSGTSTARPSPRPTTRPSSRPEGDDRDDDDEVRVLTPRPSQLGGDDDRDDDRDDDDQDDDDRDDDAGDDDGDD
ncbi:hypothetical protein [Nocardioides pacificus]